MKNDILHHSIRLNLVFTKFCRIFPEKQNFGSGKPDTQSRNQLVIKHNWFKMSKSRKCQPNWSNKTLKTGFFQISGKTGSRIRNFFSLKPPCGQDGANKKKFSQIGPAVPELLSLTHTNTHTDKDPTTLE